MAVTGTLALGPLLYNWSADKARDFYLRVADEVDVDRVYVGEVVCSKRQPLHMRYQAEAIERLQTAGKQVILSTLALIVNDGETRHLRSLCNDSGGFLVEINDLALFEFLSGKPFAVGPYVNIYNEGSLRFFEGAGAAIVSPPFELPRSMLEILAKHAKAELEIQVFGRMPLAISARCYHARAFRLHKDSCQFVCDKHSDGMEVKTLDGQPFLTINGTQTQSRTIANLLQEIPDMQAMGINSFRLSPQAVDMGKVAGIFRSVQQGKMSAEEGLAELSGVLGNMQFSNGFYHSAAGNQRLPTGAAIG